MMMEKLNYKLLSALLIPLGFFMASCEKDDPVPEIDQEVITDVTLTFTEVDENQQPIAGSSIVAVASDAEGISLGNALEIDVISSLEPGKQYQLVISLYNSIAGEDVTVEVAEDDTEHQFYFLGSAFVGDEAFLTYAYDDSDRNGNPVGLEGYVTVNETPTATTGTFRVVLRHDSNKDFTGADNPNFENFEQAGGESDVDVTFEVTL
jgi:hypothetical protein